MNPLTPKEKSRAYNRLYNKRRHHYLCGEQLKQPKRVVVIYPGCGYPDRMSKWEFAKWKPSDFAPGTIVEVDGKKWTI